MEFTIEDKRFSKWLRVWNKALARDVFFAEDGVVMG